MAGKDIPSLFEWLDFLRMAEAIGDPRIETFRKRNKYPKEKEPEAEDYEDYEE